MATEATDYFHLIKFAAYSLIVTALEIDVQ